MKKYGILGVIPARGGSKTVSKKNIKPLLGKPLIAYTIAPALKSKLLTRVIVSSDDKEIIDVSKRYGADVPFIRPKKLATDLALATDVIRHAVLETERLEGKKYDYVVMLQPTTPLRTTEDIDNALMKLIKTGADSVISVVNVGTIHPVRMKRIVDDRLVDYAKEPMENMPKELLPPVYIRSGAIYAVKRDILVNRRSFKGDDCRPYVMPEERAINIDSEMDFLLAEALMKKMKLGRIKAVKKAVKSKR